MRTLLLVGIQIFCMYNKGAKGLSMWQKEKKWGKHYK